MPTLALPIAYWTPTHIVAAVVLPSSCLLNNTKIVLATPANLNHLRPSTAQMTLGKLPADIILLILHNLSITSRVNLALTNKHFANLLSEAPGILSIDARRSDSHTLHLLRRDESFQYWSPAIPDSTSSVYFGQGPIFETIKRDLFDLHCSGCDKYIKTPAMASSYQAVIELRGLNALMSSPQTLFDQYGHAMQHLHDRRCRDFRKEVFEHAQTAVCQGGGRIFSLGMFQLMDLYIREKIREQNIAWAKRSVLRWVIAGMPRR